MPIGTTSLKSFLYFNPTIPATDPNIREPNHAILTFVGIKFDPGKAFEIANVSR